MKLWAAGMLCVATFLIGTRVGAQEQWVGAGRGITRGTYASASLFGDVNDVSKVRLLITGEPEQKIDVDWSIDCHSSDYEQTGSKSESSETRTPATINVPIPISDPDECSLHSGVNNIDDGTGGRIKLVVQRQSR